MLLSFDLMGHLLCEPTMSANGSIVIANLVHTEVLGKFVHKCINWLDQVELKEKKGLISDDRFTKGVQNAGCFLFYGIQDWYAPVMMITGICMYLLLPYIAA